MGFRTKVVYAMANVALWIGAIVLIILIAALETIAAVIGFFVGIATDKQQDWATWPLTKRFNKLYLSTGTNKLGVTLVNH